MSQPRKCLSGSQHPETQSHAPCLPPALRVREIAQDLRSGEEPPPNRSSPPNSTLVPLGEVSEVVQDSVKSSLWVGYRTRTRSLV